MKNEMNSAPKKWGFLRETKELAIKSGIDADTGVCRSGLDEYLDFIFPGSSWIHDESFGKHGNKNYRIRPDYRCEELKLIIEFDGVQHYQNPDLIIRDLDNQKTYESFGYKVVRIPYFIQLTSEVVFILFGKKIEDDLFPETVPSMGPKGRNTPAYCCPTGIKRMAEDFKRFPQQYEVNMKALKEMRNEFLSGAEILEAKMKEICLG